MDHVRYCNPSMKPIRLFSFVMGAHVVAVKHVIPMKLAGSTSLQSE